ncbi:MAG: glycogen/starch synthase, partial [Muribaculaceae bacterium]|nr:glycogen/starch synthase [Muribaculaceae bacterium]
MLDLLFETSWEVCNKVGGIFAVLSTKAKTLQKRYKDNLIFIGPDLWTPDTPSPSFIEARTPLDEWRSQAELPSGMKVRVGRWDVPGKPLAVLVTYDALYPYKNALYAEMWKHYRVDSLHGYGDYDESCMFAYAAALVIESIVKWKNDPGLRVVAHFDEWTTGMGLLYVKTHLPRVATVFTTHATSIGRSICGNGKPLYDFMPGYFGDQMAGELNMQSKHSLEKAAAHAADAFTTVSEVTA